jgi:uncharacterized membrane-anchored protein
MNQTLAAGFAERWQRIPKIALFGAVALIQLALLALMVRDRVQILRDGTEVTLQTRPLDPRDFLRGDYVTLGYDISTLPAGELEGTPFRAAVVFVKMAPDAEGFYKALSVHAQPVAVSGAEVLIRGRVGGGDYCGSDPRAFCNTLRITYGIEHYFVPEGEGRAIEHARNQDKVAIVAAVTPAGRAAIKRLVIDGKPVYDEPLF